MKRKHKWVVKWQEERWGGWKTKDFDSYMDAREWYRYLLLRFNSEMIVSPKKVKE